LAALVTAAQQYDHNRTPPRVVNAVSRSVIDPHLGHAIADGLDVSRIPGAKTVQPFGNPRLGAPNVPLLAAQPREPACENRRLTNFKHATL